MLFLYSFLQFIFKIFTLLCTFQTPFIFIWILVEVYVLTLIWFVKIIIFDVDGFITMISAFIVKLFFALKFIVLFAFIFTTFQVIKITIFYVDASESALNVAFHISFAFMPIIGSFIDFHTFLSHVQALKLPVTSFYVLTFHALLVLTFTNFLLFYAQSNTYQQVLSFVLVIK